MQPSVQRPRDVVPSLERHACAIYARKSTEDDATEELRSVTRQVERAREFAERRGWTVDPEHIFVDDGVSGAEFERRAGLIRLVTAARARSFDALIMSEPSRLGREQTQTNLVLKQLADAGVDVWYYLENRRATLDTAVGKFIEATYSFGSELEREKTRQRTYDAALKRAQAGYVTGGAVIGYESFPVYQSGRRDAHGQPIPDFVDRRIHPQQARVVRGIYRMYADGFGLTAIAKTLNGSPGRDAELAKYFGGVRPPSPRHGTGSWAPTAIREILRRPLYIGKVVWGICRRNGNPRGRARQPAPVVTVERPDLRIIEPELWDTVQNRPIFCRSWAIRLWMGICWQWDAAEMASLKLR